MEKVLVTGGTGLVGSAIKSIHQSRNYQFIFLSSKDCDLTNLEEIKSIFKKYNPSYVIHLAACVGGLYKNMNFKVDMFEKNMAINLNVLKCCHDFKVKKCVSCLSTCIFPDKTTYPINEEMLHLGPPHDSNDAYAYAKRMLDVHSKAYREQYGDNFMCIIPTNIYGPHDNYHLEDSHVIPALIHKCYLAKKENKPFVVWGSGTPLRQFIYSEDLAELILFTLFDTDEKETLILSVSEEEEVSIADVARLIAKEFDYPLEFDTSKSDGQFKKTADNTKLRELYKKINNKEINFKSMEEGIKLSVKWFIENYETCRK
jgi:GDP-L-fucose synthase